MSFYPLKPPGWLRRAVGLWHFCVLAATLPASGMANPINEPSPWSNGGFNQRVAIVKQNSATLKDKRVDWDKIKSALDLYTAPQNSTRTAVFDGANSRNLEPFSKEPEKALAELIEAGFLPTDDSPDFGDKKILAILTDAASTDYRPDDPIAEAIKIQCMLLWYQNQRILAQRLKSSYHGDVLFDIFGPIKNIRWLDVTGHGDQMSAYARTCLWIGISAYATSWKASVPVKDMTGADKFVPTLKAVAAPLKDLPTYKDGFLNKATDYLGRDGKQSLTFVLKNTSQEPLIYASLAHSSKQEPPPPAENTQANATAAQSSEVKKTPSTVQEEAVNKAKNDLEAILAESQRAEDKLKKIQTQSQQATDELQRLDEAIAKKNAALVSMPPPASGGEPTGTPSPSPTVSGTPAGGGQQLPKPFIPQSVWEGLDMLFQSQPAQLLLILSGLFIGGVITGRVGARGIQYMHKKSRSQPEDPARPTAATPPPGSAAHADVSPRERPVGNVLIEDGDQKQREEKPLNKKLTDKEVLIAEKQKQQKKDWETLRTQEQRCKTESERLDKLARELDEREQTIQDSAKKQSASWLGNFDYLEQNVDALAGYFELPLLFKPKETDLSTRISLIAGKMSEFTGKLDEERAAWNRALQDERKQQDENRQAEREKTDKLVKAQREQDVTVTLLTEEQKRLAGDLAALRSTLEKEKKLRRQADDDLLQAQQAASTQEKKLATEYQEALRVREEEAKRLEEAHQDALEAKAKEADRLKNEHQLALDAKDTAARELQSEHEKALGALQGENRRNLKERNQFEKDLAAEANRCATLESARQFSPYELPIETLAGQPWAENVNELRKRAAAGGNHAASLFGWLSFLTGVVKQANSSGSPNREGLHRVDVIVPSLTGVSRSVIGYVEDLYREDPAAKDTWGADSAAYQKEWLKALNALLRERLGLCMVAPRVNYKYDEDYMEAPKTQGKTTVKTVQSWAVVKEDNQMTLKPAEVEYR